MVFDSILLCMVFVFFYVFCGFVYVVGVGIVVGGFGVFVGLCMGDLMLLVFKSFVVVILVMLFSGCIVGMFYIG